MVKVEPRGMLLMMLAGWINRHQQEDVITYLKEDNKILRERLGPGIVSARVSLVQGSTSQSQA